MKLFLIKALIVTAVGLTMYMGVIMVEEDASKNRNEIVTLNRKINSLEDTLADVEKELTHVKILYKALRTTFNNRSLYIDAKIEQKIEDKWKEETATGGLGVLTGGLPIQGDADVDWFNRLGTCNKLHGVRYDRSFGDSDR